VCSEQRQDGVETERGGVPLEVAVAAAGLQCVLDWRDEVESPAWVRELAHRIPWPDDPCGR
jgi:hypothetical protein